MTAATETVIKTLKRHIEANTTAFKNVYEEFPNANEKLLYPSVSLETKPSNFIPYPPTPVRTTPHPTDPTKIFLFEKVGSYEVPIQLDIWARDKVQRNEMYKVFFRLFNKGYFKNSAPMGLSIELIDSNNTIARYEQLGYNYIGKEEGAIRGEWRVIINLMANFNQIEKVTRSRMSIIELRTQISDNVNVDENDTTIEEITLIN